MSTTTTGAAMDCRPKLTCVDSHYTPFGETCDRYAFVSGCVEKGPDETCKKVMQCMQYVNEHTPALAAYGCPEMPRCVDWQAVLRCDRGGKEYTVPLK